jgi:hypothetical protein
MGGVDGDRWLDSCGLRIVVLVDRDVRRLEHDSIGAEHQVL